MALSTASAPKLRSNKIVFAVIAILMVLVFIGALSFLRNVYETETYYELRVPLSERSQIIPAGPDGQFGNGDDMIQAVTTSKGSAPLSVTEGGPILGLNELQSGQYFTRYPLQPGELLTVSNTTTGRDDITVGVPDTWVMTSFSVNADDAVGGRIRRGVYFDMMIITEEGVMYPYHNVLALDTTVSLSGASSAGAIETAEAQRGQTEFYYVAMSVENAAKFHHMLSQYGGDIKLMMSPRANQYSVPDPGEYSGLFTWNPDEEGSLNLGEGTDNTFRDPERDEHGRPIIEEDICYFGNDKSEIIPCDEDGAQPFTIPETGDGGSPINTPLTPTDPPTSLPEENESTTTETESE